MTNEEEKELISKAKQGAAADVAALLRAMRPILMKMLQEQFEHLSEGFADIFDDAEMILGRWVREGPDSTKISEKRDLGCLAWRLCAQAAKNWTRAQKSERRAVRELKREAGLLDPAARPGVSRTPLGETVDPRRTAAAYPLSAREALATMERLGEPHRTTLITETVRVLEGDRRSLAEILGISADSARQRLSRARLQLLKRAQLGKKENDDV